MSKGQPSLVRIIKVPLWWIVVSCFECVLLGMLIAFIALGLGNILK